MFCEKLKMDYKTTSTLNSIVYNIKKLNKSNIKYERTLTSTLTSLSCEIKNIKKICIGICIVGIGLLFYKITTTKTNENVKVLSRKKRLHKKKRPRVMFKELLKRECDDFEII